MNRQRGRIESRIVVIVDLDLVIPSIVLRDRQFVVERPRLVGRDAIEAIGAGLVLRTDDFRRLEDAPIAVDRVPDNIEFSVSGEIPSF